MEEAWKLTFPNLKIKSQGVGRNMCVSIHFLWDLRSQNFSANMCICLNSWHLFSLSLQDTSWDTTGGKNVIIYFSKRSTDIREGYSPLDLGASPQKMFLFYLLNFPMKNMEDNMTAMSLLSQKNQRYEILREIKQNKNVKQEICFHIGHKYYYNKRSNFCKHK